MTRADILRSALELFTASGYTSVTMPEIAARAGVSVPTIYTAIGGKPQLLLALLDAASTDVVSDEAMRAVSAAESPSAALRALAHGTRLISERHQWLLTTLFDNAAAEPLVAERVAAANADLQMRLEQTALRLQALGAGADRPASEITTVLLFYFGVAAWRVLRSSDWSWDAAEEWLVAQAAREIAV